MNILEFRKELAEVLSARGFTKLDDRGYRRGAVLMILYPKGDDIRIIFTVRSMRVSRHKGEAAFPGGEREEGDKDLLDTALRETYEEIGLGVPRDQVLGRLDDCLVRGSKFIVTPFVAFLNKEPKVSPNPIEVSDVIAVPLSMLMAPGALEEGVVTWRGKELRVPFFRYGRYKIWGATERILRGFLEIVRECKSLQ